MFSQNEGIQNGGMFTREQIQRLTQQVLSLYGHNNSELQPDDMARCMIDTYRGMNKHYIPTGYQLSSFARVFDKSRKGSITAENIQATASRLFLTNQNENKQSTFR